MRRSDESENEWMARWLDAVQSRGSTMSQRLLSSVDGNGGIDAAIEAAERRGVHLAQLTDDQGKRLVVASLHSFRTLC